RRSGTVAGPIASTVPPFSRPAGRRLPRDQRTKNRARLYGPPAWPGTAGFAPRSPRGFRHHHLHRRMNAPASQIEARFADAAETYAALGVDASAAIDRALAQAISLHCWQADDGAGLERPGQPVASGGLLATGQYPGRARDGDEIRADLAAVLRLLPGRHRVNVHASYAEAAPGEHVDRDALEARHFSRWVDWAREHRLGFDFNSTFYNHPLAADGFTLSHPDSSIRDFWVRHGIACRRIAAAIG